MTFQLLMSFVPWIVVLIASAAWYGYLGWETLKRVVGRIGGYWFPIGLIVVVDLIAAGRLAADMGLPALFRDDPLRPYTWHSRAIWGACTATYLVGLVWTIIYLFLFIDPNNFNTLPSKYPVEWKARYGWAVPCRRLDRLRSGVMALKFLAATTPPFLLLLLVIGAFPAEIGDYAATGRHRALYEALEYAIGIAIGATVVCAVVLVAWRLARPIAWLRLRLGVPRLRNWIWPSAPETPLQRTALSTAWAVLAVNALLTIYPFLAAEMSPSFAVGMLLCLVALGYLMLTGTPRPFRAPLIVAIAILVGVSNGRPYKYRFPGMDMSPGSSYYSADNLDKPGPPKGAPKPPLLDDTAVLCAWKCRLNEEKPRLVLVAASGGGYRASFWTATVLDRLSELSAPGDKPGERLVGLTDRIRLITGASGGMVGASHYVAMRAGATLPHTERTREAIAALAKARGEPADLTKLVDVMAVETRLDSLSRVVQQLVQRDLPGIFWPTSYQRVDRGTVFEDEWTLLDGRTFAGLREMEKDGSLPSLIVSPMIVETGGRLLISNLDVSEVAEPVAVSGVRYSPSGREFFRRFPGAQDSFLLKTAARMSASFPYVLPAVNLPTAPPSRLVDAGYYDNFGVNLAAAWAYKNREWIRRETSGLALIQINAFPRELDPFNEQPKPVGSPSTGPETAGDAVAKKNEGAFQWLTSPLEGGAAARDWSMYYRNQEQLRLLDDTFNGDKNQQATREGKRFFEGFVFTNEGQAAMNVIISADDIASMQADISSAGPLESKHKNFETLGHLIDWWNERPISSGAKNEAVPRTPTSSFQDKK
jgi:hypothetical protein